MVATIWFIMQSLPRRSASVLSVLSVLSADTIMSGQQRAEAARSSHLPTPPPRPKKFELRSVSPTIDQARQSIALTGFFVRAARQAMLDARTPSALALLRLSSDLLPPAAALERCSRVHLLAQHRRDQVDAALLRGL